MGDFIANGYTSAALTAYWIALLDCSDFHCNGDAANEAKGGKDLPKAASVLWSDLITDQTKSPYW